MKSTTLSIILTIVITLGVLAWLGSTKASGPEKTAVSASVNSASALTTEKADYDFGTIRMKDGLVEKTFALQNFTTSDVTIKKVTTSCMCTKAYVKTDEVGKGPFSMEGMGGFVPSVNIKVKAGGLAEIRVVFDPNAHGPAGIGPIGREVYVKDDLGRILTLRFKSVVTP